ncbi:DUF3560 domain-containing protein [Vibrio vulnificus]|nr:DUF3560 domain-containing protein [Vibrio vulnificus]MCU8163101.1 DUF3560 domain-containing protein [Vibrio vulnificus]RZQ45890.1 DUF3560 domain-containing protein [Vibrio vulnificus]
MAQQNTTPTLTNLNSATSVSPLDRESSPKNDISCAVDGIKQSEKNVFLASFKAGKLRKNAKKVIQKLLDCCDSLILKTQSMGLDDCWNANEPQEYDKAKFWEWYENNYSEMVIYLTLRDGFLSKVEICDCIYHFSDDLVMYFSIDQEKPAKPKVSFSQVCEALAQGYISPLNHDGKYPSPDPEKNDSDDSRRVVSFGDYQARIESKKERFSELSNKAQNESVLFYQASKDRASLIPFGQPILVGHHSEKRARKDAERIWRDMGKSVHAQEKADHYENKANNVGSAGIASDDPEAVSKLKEKLMSLQDSQETMKSINKVIRSHNLTDEDKIEFMVQTHKFSESQAKSVLFPKTGSAGFADYALKNNNANIRTIKQRIEELENLHSQKPFDQNGEVDGFSYLLYEEEGRIKFRFDEIPSDSVRNVLKSNGFKWSRFSGAWVRKITANAVSSTRYILKMFTTL